MVLSIVLGVLLFVLGFWKVVWNFGNLEGSFGKDLVSFLVLLIVSRFY